MSLGRTESQTPSWNSPSLGSLPGAEARGRSENCGICGRKFGLGMSRRTCKFCGRQVCERHSQGRYLHSETNQPERICDLCDRERIGGHLKTQLQTYIAQLKETKTQLRADISAQREACETLNSLISKLSKETGTHSQSKTDRLSILESRISIETTSIGAYTHIGKEVEESLTCSHTQLEELQGLIEAKLTASQVVREDIAKLQQDIRELEARVDERDREARASVARTSVSSLICSHCSPEKHSQPTPPNSNSTLVTIGWNRSSPPASTHKSCSACALM
jgi:superfamily II DNA helicase RecQ